MAPTIQGSRMSSVDPSSYCESDKCTTKHLDWNVKLDFGKQIVSGHVKLEMERKVSSSSQVLLDTRDLDIQAVHLEGSNEALHYKVDNPADVLIGSRLCIDLPSTLQGNSFTLRIQYATSPISSALQWLQPEQTNGKRQPYLYSQCQAIHARSLLPCQDSPAIKCTYTAKVEAPKEITVLMSALRHEPPESSGDLCHVTSFEMKVPVPSYLIAIVGGDIESRVIGPRSKVWAEREVVDEAAEEFSETEAMLKAAEDIAGPYVWGHYDLLVLPACFPYGGMENPCLTFVTPTLLAGDKSLADVIAHEISHSWTGNLVTNATPEHFWLNEGHTMFLERKILGRLKGEPHRQIHANEGWQGLTETVKNLKQEGKEVYIKLVPELIGVDPDEAFSRIPYEKGFALLAHIESLLGGPEKYEPFLRHYIETFKGKSITSQDWKDCLCQHFTSEMDQKTLKSVDWDGWLYGMDMPPCTLSYDLSLVQASLTLARRWLAQPDSDLQAFSSRDLEGFTSDAKRVFVTELLSSETPLSQAKIQHLESLHQFNEIRNSETRFKWQRLCIKSKWTDIVPHVLRFLNEQGRMKFVIPLYKDMFGWEDIGRSAAINNFREQRHEMHTTTAKKVAQILHLEE